MASLRWWNSEHGTVVGHSPLDHQASFECCSFYLSATRLQMCAMWVSIAYSYHRSLRCAVIGYGASLGAAKEIVPTSMP